MLVVGTAVMLILAAFAVLSRLAHHPGETFLFLTLSGAMVASSLAIVFTHDIVRSAAWLLGALGAAAGLYLLLAANFLAAVQLIVYAGGILVLISFGVMLTGRGFFVRFEPRPIEVALAGLAGLVLLGGLAILLVGRDWPVRATPAELARVRTIGQALLTDWLVPFELVSVLLLAVMIGAAYLARPERR
jgi:NADH-quinone oxidoreductase subunit J